MKLEKLRIGLATLKHPASIEQGLKKISKTLATASKKSVDIVCFPETYLPGLRGTDVVLPDPNQKLLEMAQKEICNFTRKSNVAAIVGMEWQTELGLHNSAFVFSSSGRILGYQAKNQITPDGEDRHYVPDGKRRIFRIKDVPFGIVICHEGWRYPETVRWAAVKGAKIVFQPQWTGSDYKKLTAPHDVASGKKKATPRKRWGDAFYEKAMVCRAQENAIYFASVNTALKYPNSATSLIDPNGNCVAYSPYGEEDLLIRDIDLTKATRRYAKRYNTDWYPE